MVQRNLLSSSVLVVGAGGIGSILLLLLAARGMVCITVVDHDDIKVSNLHRQVIHTNRRIVTSKARSACGARRALNPTVSVMSVMEPLTWDNDMVVVRGNNCVVDARNNPCTGYLINNACMLAGT